MTRSNRSRSTECAARALAGTLSLAIALGGTLVCACAPSDPLDHEWDDAHCAVTFDTTFVWDPTVGVHTEPRALVYLRRHAGAAALVVQLAMENRAGYPYPSGPTVRIAIPSVLATPATLAVNVDATDVRGPRVVTPGTAWVIAATDFSTLAPYDGWLFGTGSIDVQSLAMTENDSSSRDTMTIDVTLDLSKVIVTALSSEAGAPPPVGKGLGRVLHVRCADDGAPP
jgi:hypothetical protein